ncbi:sensor histidine kinase [Methylosinus sporium]|uniref:sensor histidine kinase n=1 Tax=Methylosinus sporium TaxID=428 RepID=UPI00383BF4D0
MRSSLTLRLSVYLLAGQVLCFAGTMVGAHLIELTGITPWSHVSWNYFAEIRARMLVAASLVRGPDGVVSIEPTRELRALVEKHPTLSFAAFDPKDGLPLPGSSPDLAAALRGHDPILTEEMAFRIRGVMKNELMGSYRLQDTPVGAILIATHGYIFEWKDLFRHIYDDIFYTLKQYSPTIIIAVTIGWLTLRRGLGPLQQVVEQAGLIDMSSLDQRMSLVGIPSEIMPLVATINEALARLDAGVTRQRRFLANAAHELRTPLTIMTARINGPEKPTFKKDLDRDVRRLRNIVEQLLVYARFNKGDGSPKDEIDLVELTQAVVDDHALVAVKNSRSIEFESESESIQVRGDRRALESVVSNLIDNALRAEPENGTVLARVRPGAIVEIVDHGEGVEESDREIVFEPFWRKSEMTPGTGLGLAIAKELIDAHGGTIDVTETPGGGATFKISLPLASAT